MVVFLFIIKGEATLAYFIGYRTELRVTVPVHSKDLPEKTLRAILKQTDITDEEFLKLLRG